MGTPIYHAFAMIFTAQNQNLLLHILYRYPHGVLEIPAFILSFSMYIMIFITFLKSGGKMKYVIESYRNFLIVYLLIILPLFLIAAFIESLILSR
jgi:uncharacterized membrane protein SpoIIM required for sporulation